MRGRKQVVSEQGWGGSTVSWVSQRGIIQTLLAQHGDAAFFQLSFSESNKPAPTQAGDLSIYKTGGHFPVQEQATSYLVTRWKQEPKIVMQIKMALRVSNQLCSTTQ